jgi:NDP-sugar pyrophosphorylase family protein
MSYRVCIPTAGTGSRLGSLTRFINKSLVSIANRPTLCHLIEQFPDDTEFVIALGHKAKLMREFLELAYPGRKFFFADVQPFEGPGAGLGLSLLACKEFLQQPFIFISCDTLVKETIPALDENWMAYAETTDLESYRTLTFDGKSVVSICEKGTGKFDTNKAYIGLAGIHDYKIFWESMEHGADEAIKTGEAHGLSALIPYGITAHEFTWFDTGNPTALARARDEYFEPDAPTILEKANEAIWFIGDQVIKFSDDQNFIANRVKRVKGLQGFVPDVTGDRPHMYRYSKVDGKVVSELVTLPLFGRLLEHGKSFWLQQALSTSEASDFKKTCLSFYRDKTFERVELFYKNFSREDGSESINGQAMPRLDELLNKLDWEWLSDGLSGRFHGDFHFENMLWNGTDQKFTFLDWRQDFGGNLTIGDIYYDLAKLLHGLIINHEIIAGNFFKVEWRPDEISYDFHRKQILVDCEQYFGYWLEAEGYDRKKIWVLTALIYLNIAALHHHPYSLLLFALGKSMLNKELGDNE